MTELPESTGSGTRRPDAGAGDVDSGALERPKLVAVPRPAAPADVTEPAPASADAPPASGPAVSDPHAARLALERALRGPRARPSGSGAVAATPAGTGPDAAARDVSAAPGGASGASERRPATDAESTPELVGALRAELAMRATTEASLRARAVDAETRLATRVVLAQRTAETLREVRAELDRLAELTASERSRREAAERRVAELESELTGQRGRSDDAKREIATLRESLQALRTPAAGVKDDRADTQTTVTPDRLADALTRLRAGAEPIDDTPAADPPAAPGAAPPRSTTAVAVPTPAPPAAVAVAGGPTLAGPFRTLCRRDPALAGRLALSLLAMERVAHPHPIAFDLVLGPGRGCVQVTSSETRTDVVTDATPRPVEQVAFRAIGGPDRLARLLVAGRLRRRLGFGVSRIRGDRDGLMALDALLALPLDLPTLVDGGMSSDPAMLLSLAAAMVAPEWTRGAHFALSHRDGDAPPTYLLFAGGRRPEVTPTAPTGPIATVISCAEHDLASVLTGAMPPGTAAVQVLGDTAPLHQLQGWIKRAQSG